jgi:hypothetical protein
MAKKKKQKNALETYYIQYSQHYNTNIKEQAHITTDPLFQFAYNTQPRDYVAETPT